MTKQNTNASLINVALSLHVFIIVLLLAYFGKLLFIPLFFSFLLAVFLYPLCKWFELRGLNRLASAILCMVIMLLCIGTILFFVETQFQHFLQDMPSLKGKFDEL